MITTYHNHLWQILSFRIFGQSPWAATSATCILWECVCIVCILSLVLGMSVLSLQMWILSQDSLQTPFIWCHIPEASGGVVSAVRTFKKYDLCFPCVKALAGVAQAQRLQKYLKVNSQGVWRRRTLVALVLIVTGPTIDIEWVQCSNAMSTADVLTPCWSYSPKSRVDRHDWRKHASANLRRLSHWLPGTQSKYNLKPLV